MIIYNLKGKKCYLIMKRFADIPEEIIFKIIQYDFNTNILKKNIIKSKIIKEKNQLNEKLIKYKLCKLDKYTKQYKIYHNKLDRSVYFLNKYYKLQYDYYFYLNYNKTNLFVNPLLLDLLFTGCNLPYAESTYDLLNDDVFFKDLKEIVELMPNLIHSKFGQLRCRNNVTPLHAACINTSIPIKIIKFLLEKGARIEPILLNGQPIDMLDDMIDNISMKRYNEIKNIFLKYNFKSNIVYSSDEPDNDFFLDVDDIDSDTDSINIEVYDSDSS